MVRQDHVELVLVEKAFHHGAGEAKRVPCPPSEAGAAPGAPVAMHREAEQLLGVGRVRVHPVPDLVHLVAARGQPAVGLVRHALDAAEAVGVEELIDAEYPEPALHPYLPGPFESSSS